jgi:hypothetical protein
MSISDSKFISYLLLQVRIILSIKIIDEGKGLLRVDTDADLTQAPTFDWPIIGGCLPARSSGFKVIVPGHKNSEDWVNLTSASTPEHCCGCLSVFWGVCPFQE